MTTPPTVLFICQHNAGRSQLGAHMLRVVAPDQFIATSARPAIQRMKSTRSLPRHFTKSALTRRRRARASSLATDLATADVVVTMKPGLRLPGPVRGRLVEWEFPNPEEWDLDGVRGMRDAVGAEVHGLVAELNSSQ